jgi:hypothetical protein
MDWVNWITPITALGGIGIAAINASVGISDARANRFFNRSKDLLELRDVVTGGGPLQGERISRKTEEAHKNLLRKFELEARANAVLYLEATSRLSKPGSIRIGLGEVAYGVFLIWLVANSHWNSRTEAQAIGVIIAAVVFLIPAMVLIVLGVRQFDRRLRTRRLRGKMGVLDDLTIEGSAWVRDAPKVVAQKVRSRIGRSSAR